MRLPPPSESAESMGYENTYAVLPAHIPEYEHDAETQAFTGTVSNAILAPEPTRLRSNKELVPWDLTLQEVVFYALSNAQVIRQSGQFLSPNNALLRSPDGVPTAYDTAIQSSGVLFGHAAIRPPSRSSTRSSPRACCGATAHRSEQFLGWYQRRRRSL